MADIKLSRIVLGSILFALPALAGCAADWWTVDQSAYQAPSRIADEMNQFAGRAPVAASQGGAGQQTPGGAEQGGDPVFQPHPAK